MVSGRQIAYWATEIVYLQSFIRIIILKITTAVSEGVIQLMKHC